MKKIVGLLLVGIIGVTLASCGEQKEGNTSQIESSTNTESISAKDVDSSESEKKDKESQIEEISLVMNKEFTTNDEGIAIINGKTTPEAKVKIGLGVFKNTKADLNGDFELKYNLELTESQSINIVASKDGKKAKQSISIIPSEQFIALTEQKQAEYEAKKAVKDEEKARAKAEKENNKSSTNKNYEEANNEISENLRLKQGWASGTIDSDGNPTDNDTPNPEYSNWMYVNSIVYTGTNIEVQVTADFQSFSSSEKDLLASSSQGIVMSNTDLTERPHIFFFNGENSYGGSKVFSANEYKWY